MDKKTLLLFAHHREAQAFISFFKMKNFAFFAEKTYICDDYYLLITHEGVQKTTERLSSFLAIHNHEIEAIYNFGIAASIDNNIKINESYSIRTVFRELDNEMQFASFTTADNNASTDLITSNQRVLNDKKAHYLNCFAPIVDRELWAIGSLSKLFKIPFYSYKMISDIQGNNEQNVDLCLMIKENASFYSLKLLQYFQQKYITNINQNVNTFTSKILASEELYFTVSSIRKYKNLINALKIKLKIENEEQIIKLIDLDFIIQNEKNKKKRTSLLFTQLQDTLNPFQKKVKLELSSLTSSLKSSGCDIKFSETLEDDQISLAIKIKNSVEFNKFKFELEQLPYKKIVNILNGKDHV